MTDPYLINGVDLATRAVALSTAEGLQDDPERRSRDVEIPGRHGVLDVGSDPTAQRRAYGPGWITFTGWVKGVDPVTGAWPDGTLATYFARVDDLMSMFHARSLQIDHVRPDGIRRAVARLAAAITPAREPASPWFGRWQAKCVIPGAFWADVDPTTVSGTLATGGALSLAAFDGATAPLDDLEIRFGPGSNPSLIQGGTFVAYDGVISSGRELLIDVGARRLTAGAGTAWTPTYAALRYGPGPSWFELDPTAASQVFLTHTGGGSMSCSVSGRRKYLTG